MSNHVEIESVGIYEIKHNYLHREVSRIETYDTGLYKILQFNNYDRNEPGFQNGYDAKNNPIKLKLIDLQK